MSPTSTRSTPMKSTWKSRAGPKALAAALASALLAAAAHAGAAHRKLVLSGYESSVGGASLLAGHYDRVISELGSRGASFAQDEVAASTNLCVAYIMTRRWDAAHPACDEAIAIAEMDVSGPTIFSLQVHDGQVALAYSNRAVLELLEERPAGAADDLSRARALSPGSEIVSQNTATLESGSGAGVLAAMGR
jgi:hypothetical protein